MNSWWADELEPRPSQGDVFASALFLASPVPPQSLEKRTLKGNQVAWVEIGGEHASHNLAIGKRRDCIILSHSCELDKERRNKRIVVVPIAKIDTLQEKEAEQVLLNGSYHHLPLPELPGRGTCFADFRSMVSLPHDLVVSSSKLASMTEVGRERLQMQLITYFTRRVFEFDAPQI